MLYLYVQEKLAKSRSVSAIDSLNGRLQKAQTELEHLSQQLSAREGEGPVGEVQQLRHRCQLLETRVKVST